MQWCSGADAYSGAVTDWARFLPLSNRNGDDEGTVSRDRSPAVAELLFAIATALNAEPTLLTSPTLRPGVSGDAAIREVLSELRAPWWRRWAISVGAVEVPRPEVAAIPAADLSGALRACAGTLAQPGVRAGIRDLGSVLVLALDLQAAHELAFDVDPILCGAVALDLALRSRMPQRSVVTARTFVAVDGGWQVGRGPQLQASAASIVLFLAGRGDLPPEAPTSAS